MRSQQGHRRTAVPVTHHQSAVAITVAVRQTGRPVQWYPAATLWLGGFSVRQALRLGQCLHTCGKGLITQEHLAAHGVLPERGVARVLPSHQGSVSLSCLTAVTVAVWALLLFRHELPRWALHAAACAAVLLVLAATMAGADHITTWAEDRFFEDNVVLREHSDYR